MAGNKSIKQDSVLKRTFIVVVILLTGAYYLNMFTETPEMMLLGYMLLVLSSPVILFVLVRKIHKNKTKK